MFKQVHSKVDFPALERQILEFWRTQRSFEKLVEKNRGREKWSFIDGPITANNPMGVHHAWGRTYKDIYQRYHAMLGQDQRYQNGFDCQGLWVEVEVERELGFNSKREIEEYGLDKFSEACRERVVKYAAVQTQQSIRLGQWMDWDHSYYTMSDTNIEYIWYFLKVCSEKGWLYLGRYLMPWCIRCATSLSQHELSGTEAYKDMTHTSVFVRLPLLGREREYLLLWTTTPWTLTSNVAAAVHPDLEYVKVRQGDDHYYLSGGALAALEGPYEVEERLKGSELVGWRYAGPFDELPAQAGVEHRVVPWTDVGEEEGTGIVHIAPGCGAEDYELSKEHHLAVIAPLTETGEFLPEFGFLAGLSVRDVVPAIFDSLDGKGYLYRLEEYEHRYPVCWRCGEELVFRLVEEWFIAADELRPRLIRAARTVDWTPAYAGKRMEDWLNNMRDWCISRKRYWGLPLPFYRCGECREWTFIGSRAELEERAVSGLEKLRELHRPWIDEVKIRCGHCGGVATRVTEVGDCWLDAGIVPFSTLGYLDPDRSYWEQWFPADFITEMREQIRLWFYSMLFMSVALEDAAPYRAAMVYEKVHDELGRPMHKSAGNAIWFDEAVERMGADVMRWIYASQNITANLNFGYGPADEVRRKLLTLWNTYSFFVTYANIDGFDPSQHQLPVAERSELDRWILARLQVLTRLARQELESYNVAAVTRAAEQFIDDLSNWYVRRSRRRFWKGGNDTDKVAAYVTLYECLVTLSRILAPVVPFLAEEIYQNLVRTVDAAAPASVHHTEYPAVDASLIDEALLRDVALVMQVVGLGRAARNQAQIKVRQPLASLRVRPREAEQAEAVRRLSEQIAEELNVKRVEVAEDAGELVAYTIRPNLPVLGPRLGKQVQAVRAALAAADPAVVAAAVRRGQPVALSLDGTEVELSPGEVLVEVHERPGLAVAEEAGLVVALDTTLTPRLVEEGLARDLVRQVQSLRKTADFDIADKIDLYCQASGQVAAAIQAYADYIRGETLAAVLEAEAPPEGAQVETVSLGGTPVTLGIRRTS